MSRMERSSQIQMQVRLNYGRMEFQTHLVKMAG